MFKAFKLALALIALALIAPMDGLAAGKANLVFIFDASGSMWGQINGTAKIDIAKEAMDLIVNDLPPDMNVGLVAYGHRQKGDCDDVEILIPLGPLDSKTFLAKINALSPKGKTPMVRSIRKTADTIKHLEDETTILLVSDGEETCDPDPCGFVKELKELGINFVMHVVGFDVGGSTEEQLRCMAQAGGGEYFPAKDAGNLKKALTTVIKKTVDKNLKVSIFLNGKPIGGTVEVTDPNTGERAGHRSSSVPEPILMGVAPGAYKVTVTDEWQQEGRPTLVFEDVQINESEVREITANFGSGTLNIWTYQNGKPFKARTRLSTLADETVGGGYETSYPDKPAQYILQPGNSYKLMAEDSWGAGTQKDLGIVEIAAGLSPLKRKVSFDTGELVVWTHRNGKPFHASVIVSDMNGKTMGGGWGTTYEDRPETYTLEPGVYSLDAEDSWGEPVIKLKFGYVEIKAGQTLNKVCDFDSPPSQNQAPPAPTSAVPDSVETSATGQQATPQLSTADSPKQTAKETVSAPTASPQDLQATADQMQVQAQALASQTKADAMSQMQSAMAQMQGNELAQSPQTPAQLAATNGANAREATENPKDIDLPKVEDGPAGYSAHRPTTDDHGAQADQYVGARPSTVDYSNVGAVDTGGGLTEEDERPEQGQNPYEGMSTEEMQAAFAKDVGGINQKPQHAFQASDWRLGSDYQADAANKLAKLRADSESLRSQAQNLTNADGRNQMLNRLDRAEANIASLEDKIKSGADRETLQRIVFTRAKELQSIGMNISMF